MVATAAQVREAQAWVQRYAQQVEKLRQQTERVGQARWSTFTKWYSAAAVAALAAEMAAHSQAAQDIASGLTGLFITNLGGLANGSSLTMPRKPDAIVIRNGAPLELVHSRPAEAYRKAIAFGATPQTARQKAALRATQLLRNDVTLAERLQAQRTLDRLGVKEYRRIIHPELSKGGSCGLCIAAADRVYKTGQLMPIHGHCECTVMPVVGSWDPGVSLNDADLKQLYTHAGDSTKAKDLKRTRYRVTAHGELGPVLVKPDDHFRGPSKVALEDDPPRARRMLDRALPVLARMEAGGQDTPALSYQRDLVARLRAIAA